MPAEHISIVESEHHVTFALIKDGKYAFAQFSNDDVPDPIDGVWDIRDGAKPFHTSVRDAHRDEAVTVYGAKYMPKLYQLLAELIAQTQSKAA